MRNFLKRSFALLLLLAGCAGAPAEAPPQGQSSLPKEVREQMAGKPMPSWVTTRFDARYPDKFFLTGVGESTSSFAEAEAQARADLAKRIEVQIEGKDSFVALETSKDGYQYAVKSDVTEGVKITLFGLTIGDRWVDSTGRRYFAFVVLNREKAVAAVRTDLDELSEQARALLAKAAEWEAQQEPLQAVAPLARLQGLAGDVQALRKRYLVMRGDLPEPRPLTMIPSPVEIEQRLDDLLASLRLLPVSGDGQRAVLGKPLDQPLVVKLMRRRGDTETPVRDLPILFAFERGQGQVEQTKKTDQSGQARVTVRDVRASAETAAIAAKPDVEALMKGLPPAIGQRVLDKLGRQVVVFNVVPSRGLQAGADPWMNAIGKLSEDLLNHFDFDDKGKPTMAVLDFVETYGSQRLPFSQRLESGLRTALSQWEFVSIVEKNVPAAAAKSEDKARALGVGHYVDGVYELSNDTLTVNASLRKLSDGTTKAAAFMSIPRGALTSQDLQGFLGHGEQTPSTIFQAPPPSATPLPPSAQSAYDQLLAKLVMLRQPNPPFKVKLWTEKSTYNVGDKVVFFFESEQDCYLTLIDIGTSGRLTVLFPNQWEKNNFVSRGRRVAIPEPHYGFDIDVNGPTGTERVKAIVTTEPFTLFENMNFANGFFGLTRDGAGARDFKLSPKQLAPNQWTDAAIEVLILERCKTEPRGRGLMRGVKPQNP